MGSADTIPLDPAPSDAVSRASFSATGDLVLVSTWAGTLTVHASSTGLLKHEAPTSSRALLDAVWTGPSPASSSIAAASLDGRVLLTSPTEAALSPWTELGTHDDAARCVVSLGQSLVTGGWDATVRFWDARLHNAQTAASVDAGGKVYAMCRCGENSVVFATSARTVRVLDTRKTGHFVHDKTPPTLQYQLRGLSASADGAQYVVGSTEGRVAVEWLDGKAEPFSFKCHRADGLAFPVNAIAHNGKYGSFATGGGDGHVAFWDGEAKKRIAQYSRYQTSVASLGFDEGSQRIVVAVSYTFEEGEKDHPPDEVHIRKVDDGHIATKSAMEGNSKGMEGTKEKPPSTTAAAKE